MVCSSFRLYRAPVLVIILLAATFVASAHPILGEEPPTKGPPPPPIVIRLSKSEDQTGRDVPSLTPKEKARAKDILADAPALQSVLAGQAYSITEIGPGIVEGKKVGASLTVTFPEPLSVQASWPQLVISEDDSADTPFNSTLRPISTKHLQDLSVLIDLQTDQIVDVDLGLNSILAAEPDAGRSPDTLKIAPDESSPQTRGASGGSFGILAIEDDRFYNWDFWNTRWDESTTKWWWVRRRADWPVTMLFWNRATVKRVKRILTDDNFVGSRKYGRLIDDIYFTPQASDADTASAPQDISNWVWDADSGVKNRLCPVRGAARHMRLYADSDDHMYNIFWGYYVFGTTHFDANECTNRPKYGWSDTAEWEFTKEMSKRCGRCGFAINWADFFNREPHRVEWVRDGVIVRKYVYENDGYGTAVRMP